MHGEVTLGNIHHILGGVIEISSRNFGIVLDPREGSELHKGMLLLLLFLLLLSLLEFLLLTLLFTEAAATAAETGDGAKNEEDGAGIKSVRMQASVVATDENRIRSQEVGNLHSEAGFRFKGVVGLDGEIIPNIVGIDWEGKKAGHFIFLATSRYLCTFISLIHFHTNSSSCDFNKVYLDDRISRLSKNVGDQNLVIEHRSICELAFTDSPVHLELVTGHRDKRKIEGLFGIVAIRWRAELEDILAEVFRSYC